MLTNFNQEMKHILSSNRIYMNSEFKNASIVDVRTPEEYADEHVSGAINIPLHEVRQRVDEFKNMQKPIIAYCKSGNRSGQAVYILQRAGIIEAINGGGLMDMLTCQN